MPARAPAVFLCFFVLLVAIFGLRHGPWLRFEQAGDNTMKKCWISIALLPSLLTAGSDTSHQASAAEDLVISTGGRTDAVVVVSPDAGDFERRAADDLAKYIGMMSGDQPAVASSEATISAAMEGTRPLLLVGQQALELKPVLNDAVNAVLKKDPHLRTDGIVVKHEGNRV